MDARDGYVAWCIFQIAHIGVLMWMSSWIDTSPVNFGDTMFTESGNRCSRLHYPFVGGTAHSGIIRGESSLLDKRLTLWKYCRTTVNKTKPINAFVKYSPSLSENKLGSASEIIVNCRHIFTVRFTWLAKSSEFMVASVHRNEST